MINVCKYYCIFHLCTKLLPNCVFDCVCCIFTSNGRGTQNMTHRTKWCKYDNTSMLKIILGDDQIMKNSELTIYWEPDIYTKIFIKRSSRKQIDANHLEYIRVVISCVLTQNNYPLFIIFISIAIMYLNIVSFIHVPMTLHPIIFYFFVVIIILVIIYAS